MKVHLKTSLKNILLWTAFASLPTACGVKGDPVPPDRPAELGRGRPTYRRATEKLKVVPIDPEQDKDERNEEGEK